MVWVEGCRNHCAVSVGLRVEEGAGLSHMDSPHQEHLGSVLNSGEPWKLVVQGLGQADAELGGGGW